MLRRNVFSALWLMISVLASAGCGNESDRSAETGSENDSLLGDLLNDIDLTDGRPAEDASAEESAGSVVATSRSASDPTDPPGLTDVQPASPAPHAARLQLQPGDHFRFVKTVEQKLIQKTPGQPATAQTKLDLYVELAISDLREDVVDVEVSYRRVSFSQDINGQIASYDSALHIGPVPAAFAPYAGMVNNSFSFELGLDNKIRSVSGLPDFLGRCVTYVPPAQQPAVLNALQTRLIEGGVTELVDETIGLLPFTSPSGGATVATGDEWIRHRKISDPVSLNVQTTCRLLSLTPSTAEISLNETFEPITDSPQTATVQIRNRRSTGTCLIDRHTGMPVEATRSQYLSLLVPAADGTFLEQEKQIKTILVAQHSGPVVRQPTPPSALVPAVASTLDGTASDRNVNGTAVFPSGNGIQPVSGRSVPSSLSSTATAVYPD